jgi:hypothetical protein
MLVRGCHMKDMLKKSFVITVACMLITLSLLAGCKNDKEDSSNQGNISTQYGNQEQSAPDPIALKIMNPSDQTKRIIENPELPSAIATPPSAWLKQEDTSTWTTSAQAVARKFAENDYPGVVDVLYQDILNTQPTKSDHLMFYVNKLIIDTPAVYKDPSGIYRKYRDADRSGWSDEQKAAADLLVALTYEFGDNSGYFPEDIPETEDYYPLIFNLEVQGLARLKYEDIIQQYKGSKIAILASIILEQWYFMRAVPQLPLQRVVAIRDEIEQQYPNSVYLAWAQFELALRLSSENMTDESRVELDKTLALPDIVVDYDTADPDYTIHGSIESSLK